MNPFSSVRILDFVSVLEFTKAGINTLSIFNAKALRIF